MRLTQYQTNLIVYTILGAVLAFVLVAIFWPEYVWSQEAVVTPGAAVVVPESTKIVIPWGTWLSELASTIAAISFAAIVWLLRRLPSQAVAILQTLRAEQLIERAIDYAVNTTAGAFKDRTVTVPVANEVIAKAMRYAVENGAPKIVEWMGGESGIGNKIVARINVQPEAELLGTNNVTGAPILAEAPGQRHSVVHTSDVIPKGDF